MAPAVPQRYSIERQARRPDCPKLPQQLRQDRRSRKRSPLGHRRKVVEQPSRPWRIVARENSVRRSDLFAQPAKQSDAALQADQRIVVSDLKAASQIRNGQSLERRRIGSQTLVTNGGKDTGREHVQTGERQTFRTAYGRACQGITIAPRSSCARIQKYADHGEVKFGAGACLFVAPNVGIGESRP